jgi:hypothetical protein
VTRKNGQRKQQEPQVEVQRVLTSLLGNQLHLEDRNESIKGLFVSLAALLIKKGVITSEELKESAEGEAASRALEVFFRSMPKAPTEARPIYPPEAKVFGG